MRDPRRIDRIIELLRIIWKLDPDLRLGQLLCTIGFNEHNLFAREDKVAETVLMEELYIRVSKENSKTP